MFFLLIFWFFCGVYLYWTLRTVEVFFYFFCFFVGCICVGPCVLLRCVFFFVDFLVFCGVYLYWTLRTVEVFFIFFVFCGVYLYWTLCTVELCVYVYIMYPKHEN